MAIHGHGTGFRYLQAFTVLELLVTLTLAAILLVAAVPAFEQFTQRQHLRSAIGNLHNDLLAARSEAVFRNISAVACPGAGQGGCSGTSDWSSGWIVFVDENGDRQFQREEMLLRHGQVFEVVTIRGSAGRSSIRFLSDGSAPGSNGTIGFCGTGGPEQARKLVISNIGRIRRDGYPDINPDLCPG
jgi:type IV fimbrial biogenesis protein FimT